MTPTSLAWTQPRACRAWARCNAVAPARDSSRLQTSAARIPPRHGPETPSEYACFSKIELRRLAESADVPLVPRQQRDLAAGPLLLLWEYFALANRANRVDVLFVKGRSLLARAGQPEQGRRLGVHRRCGGQPDEEAVERGECNPCADCRKSEHTDENAGNIVAQATALVDGLWHPATPGGVSEAVPGAIRQSRDTGLQSL